MKAWSGAAGLLWANALLYAAFSAWCTIAPDATMHFLGLSTLGNHGVSEYFALYGGLQAALAIFFVLAVIDRTYHRLGVHFSLALYAGVVTWRMASFALVGFPREQAVFGVYALEIAMLLWSLVVTLRQR